MKNRAILAFIFNAFFSFFPLYATDSLLRPYVTCELHGQLGNQLFNIAATLAYALDNEVDAIFPDLNRTDNNIPMNRERIFYRLNNSSLPRQPKFEKYGPLFLYVSIPYQPDQILRGLFLSGQYFDHRRNEIVEILSPLEKEVNHLKRKHSALLDHPLTVGVHLRTFNKEWSQAIPFVNLDYYEKAMAFFPKETLFVIFSDRINWCKQHFKVINRPMIFIEDQDHVADLYLMSMLKHNIIGNSTYSWWAAYLNRNPDKIVVAPSHFICPNIAATVNSNMPDWIVIDIDGSKPYPSDMRDYDKYSKSLDTQ